jgi:hypothetical protein
MTRKAGFRAGFSIFTGDLRGSPFLFQEDTKLSASGLSSFGTTFKVETDQIAEVYSISGPSLGKDTQETSDLSSTGYRSFAATLKDPGEVTLGIRYLPSAETHNAATGLLGFYHASSNTAPYSCTLTFPDSTAWTFSGIFTGFEPSADVDSPLDAQVTIKLTGAPGLN